MTEDKTKNNTDRSIRQNSSSKDDMSDDASEYPKESKPRTTTTPDQNGPAQQDAPSLSSVEIEEIVRRSFGGLDEILTSLTSELESEKEKRLRLMAEYENYRRRTQTNFQKIISEAVERILLKLLPVLDDFERLFENDPYQMDSETLLQGVDLIYRKLLDQLESEGLQSIESGGNPFDVNLHEAISEKEDNSIPPGIIVSEAEKGYYLKDKVIRHSKVVVSRSSDAMDDGGGDG